MLVSRLKYETPVTVDLKSSALKSSRLNAISTGRDIVTFSSASSDNSLKSDAQKLADTEKETLKIFTENSNNRKKITEAIIENFKKEPCYDNKIYEIEIFDGRDKDNEWVNKICQAYASSAFLYIPDSIIYPKTFNDSQKTDFSNELKDVLDDDTHKHYTQTILPDLETQKKFAIFIPEKCYKNTLFHEIFHALQYKNGLAFGTDAETDQAANILRNMYNQGAMSKPVRNLLKRVFGWFVQVPLLWVKGKLKETGENTVGAAIRLNMKREMEVDRFLIKNRKALGLPFSSNVQNWWHYIFESKLQYLLSHRYDYPANDKKITDLLAK